MSEHAEGRCYAEKAPEEGPPLIINGNISFQTHHVGWIVCGFFTIVATIASFWLINKHLQWYTNKRQQRYIVRLLFMVPIYAIISLASYLFWNHATPLILLRDGYESIVLTGFFYLLLNYVSTDPDEQRLAFLKHGISKQADREAVKAGRKPSKWMFPLGFVKAKPSDGLYFLQLMKWGVLQYCVIRPLTTLVSVILDYSGLYCEASWSPGWGHIYIVVIVSISVTIAMYCLIQLYIPISGQLAPHKPLLKLFAVKAVVFLTFWQASFLSVLSMFGVVKDSKYMTAEQINIGFGALLETFEMMLFAFLHIKAFTYKPYRMEGPLSPGNPSPQRTPRFRALGHAMNFGETFKEISQGWFYLCDKLRHKESRYDKSVRRTMHLEGALGVVRHAPTAANTANAEKDLEHTELNRAERQWLGIGDNFDYSLTPIVREKSGDFEQDFEQELVRRGFDSGRSPVEAPERAPSKAHPRQSSWWRSLYDRISQSEQDGDLVHRHPSNYRRRYGVKYAPTDSRDVDYNALVGINDDYLDDLPPRSVFKAFQRSKLRPTAQDRSRSPDSTIVPSDPPIHHPENASHLHSQDSMLERVFPPSSSNFDSSRDSLASPGLNSLESLGNVEWRELPRRQATIIGQDRQGNSESALPLVLNSDPSASTEIGVHTPPPPPPPPPRVEQHSSYHVTEPLRGSSSRSPLSYPQPTLPLALPQNRTSHEFLDTRRISEESYCRTQYRLSSAQQGSVRLHSREPGARRHSDRAHPPHRSSYNSTYMNAHLASPSTPEVAEDISRYPHLPGIPNRSHLPTGAQAPFPVAHSDSYCSRYE